MKRTSLAIAVVAVVLTCAAATASEKSCSIPGSITLKLEKQDVRTALRAVAAQSGRNIAVDHALRGTVSVDLNCVSARTALMIRVLRRGSAACAAGLLVQPHVDRIRHD